MKFISVLFSRELQVGFQVGGGRSITSERTKIKFVTDTLFLNEYDDDPNLEKYSIVIVDEAHERKIDTDIVFGIMKKSLRKRKDLQVNKRCFVKSPSTV
jgi:HrpA-like RNA helicase